MTGESVYKRANLRILKRFQKLKAAEENSSISGKGPGCIFQSISHIYDIHVKYKNLYSMPWIYVMKIKCQIPRLNLHFCH